MRSISREGGGSLNSTARVMTRVMPLRSVARKLTSVTAIVPPSTITIEGASANRVMSVPPELSDQPSSTKASTRPTTVVTSMGRGERRGGSRAPSRYRQERPEA